MKAGMGQHPTDEVGQPIEVSLDRPGVGLETTHVCECGAEAQSASSGRRWDSGFFRIAVKPNRRSPGIPDRVSFQLSCTSPASGSAVVRFKVRRNGLLQFDMRYRPRNGRHSRVLCEFGMTPSSRSRVSAVPKEDTNEFAAFVKKP